MSGGALAWLRLARSRRVGPRSFAKLMARFGDPEAALDALPEIGAGAGVGAITPCTVEDAEREMEAGAAMGARLIRLADAAYPAALAEIPDPPPILWAIGPMESVGAQAVAVVGARNASAAGRRFAARLAREIGEAGWLVVSGLARGIDAAAHEAALPTGTVAVLAGGLDRIYPSENAGLAARIAESGLLLSEAPMGETPTARSFPRRNRIVSGLSQGVVLVEAAERSGSLITARMAAEQGREAMAVPGSPLDARAAGCNALIRDGAALIRSAADVIEALGAPRMRTHRHQLATLFDEPEAEPPPSDAVERLAQLLSAAPVDFDELCRLSGHAAPALSALLLELELDGRAERLAGGSVVARSG